MSRDTSRDQAPPSRPATHPILLADALQRFEALWSPRIVTQVNDYDVRIAKVAGEHVWHTHETTDEFFLVLDGVLQISLREPADPESGDPDGEREVALPTGSVFVVPRGVAHRPFAPAGASILMFEPTGTSTVGEQHEPVPDHVDATTGHRLE